MGSTFISVIEELPLKPGLSPFRVFREMLQDSSSNGTSSHPKRACYFERQDELLGKETVMGTDPFESIRFAGGREFIENANESFETLKADPFQAVGERLKLYRTAGHPTAGSFAGVALGYFAYDSVRFVEPVLCSTEGNLKRLAARQGEPSSAGAELSENAPDAEVLFFRKLVIVRGERVFLVSGYFPERKTEEEGCKEAHKEIAELRACLTRAMDRSLDSGLQAPDVTSVASAPELATEEMDSVLGHQGFIQGVQKLKGHLREGDIFQAVLSEKLSIPFTGDSMALFEILSGLGNAPYLFYFLTEHGVCLGASPEMLVRQTGDVLETHPIAGTRPRGKSPDEELRLERQLLRSEKEKSEHLMLVDLARNDLGKVSRPGSVQVESYMKLKKFSGVMHLVSRVTGRVRSDVGALDALSACFPAGTLSGAPKIRAMQLISEIEPSPRGFYGGAVIAAGFSGDLDSCIAIRSIEVRQGRAMVQAGAGIVIDSRAESEYAEVQHKSLTARRALAMALLRKPAL